MQKRIVFGTAMILVLVGLFYLDWWLEHRAGGDFPRAMPMAAVLLILVVLAVGEVARMAAATGVRMLTASAVLGSVAVALMPFWRPMLPGPASGDHVLLLVGAVTLIVFAQQMLRARTEGALVAVACTLLAIVYVGVGSAMMLNIRLRRPHGVLTFVLFMAVVKSTDIGAYFTGSAVGRHKLVGWLSPGKTWEGLAGGLAAAAGVSCLLAWAMPMPLPWWRAMVFGAVVGLVGQFADLCESLLKRSAHVKDSGALMPEFGGVLDMIDSPLLAAPVAYMMLEILLPSGGS